MTSQQPAEGILKTHDWGDSKFYTIPCSCGCGSEHELNVEADDSGIWAKVYVKTKTNWWSKNRWQNVWTLLTRGYIETYSDIHMTNQQALNYADTLKSAIIDVEKFRKESKLLGNLQNKIADRLVKESQEINNEQN
jgi:hypothetical protein